LPAGGAWGFITPCHWKAGAKRVAMSGLTLPDFSQQESQTLLAAMRPYFEEDGITLYYLNANNWLARSDLFDDLATASLDRVVGRNIENWLPRGATALQLQRLQTEMQMLLYNHPVNDARATRGVPPVNSFWLSGTGTLTQRPPQSVAEQPPVVVNALREPALQENWADWAQAWATLDATECATLLRALNQGGTGQLTLCGERNAQSFHASPQSFLNRFMRLFSTQPASTTLERL
jgi:hypothetical protein